MNLNEKTQKSINEFIELEAPKYLDYVEMTYFEKIGIKTEKLKNKLLKKLEKFKIKSDEIKNLKDDLNIYMKDYIVDLIENGYSEEDALKIAKENLKVNSETSNENEVKEHYINKYTDKYSEYYLSMTPAKEEQIGLIYGGFKLLFGILGIIIGFILWYFVFKQMLYNILVSTLLGIILGTALALLKHSSIIGSETKN